MIRLTAATASVVPPTALILGACVSQSSYDKLQAQNQQIQAQNQQLQAQVSGLEREASFVEAGDLRALLRHGLVPHPGCSRGQSEHHRPAPQGRETGRPDL
jgi:outer membrane murein-binding lipoprotein Lpp